MKFALVDNRRVEATKGAIGICPCCSSELTAKCGPVRINHWAHRKDSSCDPWWESETEWHRSWKNNYPDDWQEVPFTNDKTGEKHIADVRTIHDLVIEFQHSHIDPQERTARELYYKNMIWIVDGTRLKRDYPRFLRGKHDLRGTNKQGHYIVDVPSECFPSAWLESSVPVIFDFLGMESANDNNDLRNNLYCLFPQQNQIGTILAFLPRKLFVIKTINGEWFISRQDSPQQPLQTNKIKRRREPTHYYDPQKKRLVKRWRF